MRRKFLLILSAIILVAARFVNGQDAFFTQFYFNPVLFNPAYAGGSQYSRVGIVCKSQWVGMQFPYATCGVSYDRTIQRFRNNSMGVNVVSDITGKGTVITTNLDLIYAYTIQPSYNSYIRLGLQPSVLMRNRNYSHLIFPDMIDDRGQITGTGEIPGVTTWNFDLAVGVAGGWDIFYADFAVHHLLQPVMFPTATQSAYIPMKFTVHLGAAINLFKWNRFKDELLLTPNVVFINQGRFNQLNIGAYVTRFNFMAGVWLRENLTFHTHTFVASIGYSDDGIRVGYSYDFSILQHGLHGMPTSSHEVTLGWNFEYKNTRRKFRYIKCPKF